MSSSSLKVDHDNKKWSEEDIVSITYRAAGDVYKKHHWFGSKYDREDFAQDAAMYILEKLREGYFEIEERNPFPIIYRLINGYFVFNKYKSKYKDRQTVSLDRDLTRLHLDDTLDFNLINSISDEGLTPEELLELKYGAEEGSKILEEILNTLNVVPVKTRKYRYRGKIESEKIGLTEYNIAKLILGGKDLHDILSIFNCDVSNSGSTSKSAYIAKFVKEVKDKIVETVKNLSEEDIDNVKDMLEFTKLNKTTR